MFWYTFAIVLKGRIAFVSVNNDHRTPLEAAVSQVVERAVGVRERVRRDSGEVFDLRRELQELDAVVARQVGHRAKDALAPQVLVREGGNVAHMDAGAYDVAALPHCLESSDNKRS